jgi:acyl-CoA thioesterase FadM
MIPYAQKRVPKWSETDSAQIIYTTRFVDYAMDALEGWFRDVLRVDWFRMNTELDLGTPFVKIEMDIKSPLTPRDELEVRVLVDRMGRSSLSFNVVGVRNGDQTSFESLFVCSMVKKSTMRSISIPDDLRKRIEDYMSACADNQPSMVDSA